MIFRARSLGLFYRELSTLLEGGMPIVQAAAEVAGHTDGALRSTAWRIHVVLDGGGTLASAMREFPRLFPEWHIGLVEAGERSGMLAGALKAVADQLEKNYADVLKLAVGLSYPAFMGVAALVMLPFIQSMQGRPAGPGLSNNLLLAGLVCCALCAAWQFSGSAGRRLLQNVLLALPVLGRLLRQFAVTRFVRALQALTGAGVPVLTSWRIAAGASGNEAVRERLLGAMTRLERGGTLAESFSAARIFPSYMIALVSSGEKSGSIVKMLDSAAACCEKENEAATGVLLKIVPVAVYIAVALIIGGAIISSYTGYYTNLLNGLQ